MSMTVVATRNVPDRYRGFLASVMLEVSPGTYVSPKLSRGVRERVWQVCREWSATLGADSHLTMLWREATAPGGLGIAVLGAPRADLAELNGIWLERRELTVADEELLGRPASNATPLPDK